MMRDTRDFVCHLAKAIAVPAATICLFLLLCRVERTLNQVDSMVKRQIVINAGRGAMSDFAGSRLLLVSVWSFLCQAFRVTSFRSILGRTRKDPAVSKRSSDFLCVFYTGHVSHTVPW